MEHIESITLLVAEDDPDDRALIRDAFDQAGFSCDLRFVGDGEELMDYLLRRGTYADRDAPPLPKLILLDLNMPRQNGREALQAIKQNPRLRRIPVVVLTTSSAPNDVRQCYDLGAGSFIVKPTSFEALVKVMKTLAAYWFEIVELGEEEDCD